MTWDPEFIDLASRTLATLGFGIALAVNAGKKNWGFVLALGWAALESFHPLRYDLHEWARIRMMGDPPDPVLKHAVQIRLMQIGGVVSVVVAAALTPYVLKASSGRRLMVAGSCLGLLLLTIELISYHPVDQIMYSQVGMFRAAAVGYFLSAVLVAAGAAIDRPARIDTGAQSPT